MGGPTQTAVIGAGSVWQRRPVIARALQAAILIGPAVVALGVTWSIGHWLPASRFGVSNGLWWFLVAIVALGTVVVSERVLRRFTPVAALMLLNVAFPDEAPTRFGHALRRGTVKQLIRMRDDHLNNGRFTDETTYSQYLLALAQAIADHDRLTRGHSERVRAYSDLIAVEMGVPKAEREKFQWAALLHDVGKLDVPAEILTKPGRPDDDEWQLLKGHPAAASSYLRPLKPWLGEWIHAAEYHHARFDGDGYPHSTAAREIPLAGRIVAVADAFDVMTSRRSYKKPMGAEDARAEIMRCAGSQFDPLVVRAFMNIGVKRLGLRAGPFAWLGHTFGLEGSLSAGVGTTATTATSAGTATTATSAASVASATSATITIPNAIAATAAVVTGAVNVPVPLDVPIIDLPAAIAFDDTATELPEPGDMVVSSASGSASVTTLAPFGAPLPETSTTTTSEAPEPDVDESPESAPTTSTTTPTTTTAPIEPDDPPTFTLDGNARLFSIDLEDTAFRIVAEDPEGGPVEFLELLGLPAGVEFDRETGEVSGTIDPALAREQPNGNTMTVRARDTSGAIGEMSFDVEYRHYRSPWRALTLTAIKYAGDEFVHITNKSDQTLPIGGYRVLDHDPLTGTGDLDYTIPGDDTIDPGETYVLHLAPAPDDFDPAANRLLGYTGTTDVLADVDDVLLLSDQSRHATYVSWGEGGDIGFQPTSSGRPWITNFNDTLVGLADDEWLEVATLNDIAYKKSQCWQRNGTDEAREKGCGFLD